MKQKVLPVSRPSDEDGSMKNASHQLGVYLHLAQASFRRQRPLVRDRLFVLASAVALQLRIPKLAFYCRAQILKNNPQHLIGHWQSVEEALLDDDFLALLKRLRFKYPVERAEQLLDSLGIDMTNERETYYSDEEWAAAILNVNADYFVEREAS